MLLYHRVDTDERGEYHATVYRADPRKTIVTSADEVFEIQGSDLVRDGFMRHAGDMEGLARHLEDLGLVPPGSDIVRAG